MPRTKHTQKDWERDTRDTKVFEDIIYEKKRGVTKITINRPEVFNAGSESITGINARAFDALRIYYGSEESKKRRRAFLEKRPTNFSSRRRD